MRELKAASQDALTSQILSHAATHSPEEISRMLGGTVSPARVAAHIQTVLKQRDWLTEVQQELHLMWELRTVLANMKAQFSDLDNLKAQVTVLKVIGERLDRRKAATEVELNTYHAHVGHAMAEAYDLALSHMRGALISDIDPERWDEAAKEALLHAQAKVMERAAVED